MRKHALTLAPWCILAVVLFAGAAEEKPVPKYMQLLLLEEAAQTDLMQLVATQQQRDTETVRVMLLGMDSSLTSLLANAVGDDDTEARRRSVDEANRMLDATLKMLDKINAAHRTAARDVEASRATLRSMREQVSGVGQ